MKTTATQRIQPIYCSILGMFIYTALLSAVHFSLLQMGAILVVFALAMIVVVWEYYQHRRPLTIATSVFILGGVIAFSLSVFILGVTQLIINLG